MSQLRPFITALGLVAVGGCGGGVSTIQPTDPACGGALADIDRRITPGWAEIPAASVARVDISGLRSVPESLVREAIELPIGQWLDVSYLRADIRRLMELSVFEDVRVHGEFEGAELVVRYEVVERPVIGNAWIAGAREGVANRRLDNVAGEVFVPQRLHRLASRVTADHLREGYRDAQASVHGRRVSEHSVDVCFVIDAGRRWLIERFLFVGNERITDEELLEQVSTSEGRVNVAGGVYREDLLAEDFQRLHLAYYDRGMISAQIGEPRTTWTDDDELIVEIPVEEGPVFRLLSVRFTGDLSASEDVYLTWLGVQPGEIFHRSRLAAGIERIREHEQSEHQFPVDVSPITDLDVDRATIALEIAITRHPEGDR